MKEPICQICGDTGMDGAEVCKACYCDHLQYQSYKHGELNDHFREEEEREARAELGDGFNLVTETMKYFKRS